MPFYDCTSVFTAAIFSVSRQGIILKGRPCCAPIFVSVTHCLVGSHGDDRLCRPHEKECNSCKLVVFIMHLVPMWQESSSVIFCWEMLKT
eukprot:scaffold29807_cov38-Prasinocladus_malaysianus.AAC.1